MTEPRNTVRRILERVDEQPVLSLYFDLDPTEFATPPARATQLRSLIDDVGQQIEEQRDALSHSGRESLEQALQRVEGFLGSDDAPVSGAHALAVFAWGEGRLEAVRLHEPTTPCAVVGSRPYVEPLLRAGGEGGWCVCLVNRSTARILAGDAASLWERGELDDDVKGQHSQGGWSQARYERSVEVEVERHLQHVAGELRLRLERERFHTLVLGGPEETVAQLRSHLHGDLIPTLSDEQLSLDVQNSSEDEVREALRPLLEHRRQRVERDALEQVQAAQGGGAANAVSGLEATLMALAEQRVQKLLLTRGFHREGGRCPSCGLIVAGEVDTCPADGSQIERLDDVRGAAIEAAALQDAGVIVFEEPPPETHLRQGIGAVLRF